VDNCEEGETPEKELVRSSSAAALGKTPTPQPSRLQHMRQVSATADAADADVTPSGAVLAATAADVERPPVMARDCTADCDRLLPDAFGSRLHAALQKLAPYRDSRKVANPNGTNF